MSELVNTFVCGEAGAPPAPGRKRLLCRGPFQTSPWVRLHLAFISVLCSKVQSKYRASLRP